MTEVGQSVYAYNVNNSVIQVSDKVTAITLDKCQGTGIVFKGAVASFDVVNSKKVQVQLAEGDCPQFSVDKSEGVKIFINESAKANSSFITAHAQEVLIVVLRGDDQDPLELAIPEQFLTTFEGDRLNTAPVDHLGV